MKPSSPSCERNKEPMRVLAEALLDQESLEADEVKVLLNASGARLN